MTLALITHQDYKKNDVSTTSVDKIDNNVSSRRQEEVQKKSTAISSLIKTFALIASSVIIGVESLGLVSPPDIKAMFEYVEAYETGVYCEISLSEYQEGLTLVLSNEFTDRQQVIEEPEEDFNWYTFEDLKPNMHYTLSIVIGSHVLATTTVYTQDKLQQPNISDGG